MNDRSDSLNRPMPDALAQALALGLTPAEVELMQRLALGKSNGQIALSRGRSTATVRNQLHGIYRKLGVKTRGEAVRVWLGLS